MTYPWWIALGIVSAPAAAQSLDHARALADARDYAGAAQVLGQRIAAAPDDTEARYLLARVLAWGGEPIRALPVYEALIATDPNNPDYLLGYGQALSWAGRPAEAIRVLERAQGIAPAYADVGAALVQARAAQRAVAPASPSNAPITELRTPVVAAGARHSRRSLAVSARHDRLDRGLDDWRSVRLDAAWQPAGRTGMYGALLSEQRFGVRDAGLALGAIVPMRAGWSIQPEVGLVADADFLPSTYIDVRVQRDFGRGWIGAAGWRRSDYRDVDVQLATLGAERYAGAWRAGYTLGMTHLAGRWSSGHDLRLARGYGERSEIGLQLGVGREATLLGPEVVVSDVRAATLFGRHAFGQWSLLWNVGRVEQGEFYTREGIGLGLERRF